MAFSSARAAVYTWDGGGADSFWGTGQNWSTDLTPPNDGTADLHFAGTVRLTPVAGTAFSIKSLTFDSGAGAFTLSGGALTLASGGITQNSTNAQTINNAIILGAAQTWTLASGVGPLTLGSTAAVNNNGKLLTINGASGTGVNFYGGISGTGGLTLTTSNGGAITMYGANSYSGTTTLNANTILVYAAGSSLTGGGNISVGTGATLTIRGSVALGSSNNLTLNGTSASVASGYVLGNGALTTTGITVGTSGYGAFTQSSGTNTTNVLYLGNLSAGNGTYTLSGTGVLAATSEYIGNAGKGTFTQSGGFNTFSSTGNNSLYIGETSTGNGTYNLSGGTLSLSTSGAALEVIGDDGIGAFVQSGGVHVAPQINLGNDSTGNGSYSLSNGTLTAPFQNIGSSGTGAFTQTGGINTDAKQFYLAGNSGSTGTYTLTGGLLQAYSILSGTGTSTFNFNGGTLRATGDGSTYASYFMGGLTYANVQAGGAKIDTNGYNLTFAQDLLHGASTDGGLTKYGAGTLTLGYYGSGVGTYTGPTTISGGTLLLTTSLNSTAGTGLNFGNTGTFNVSEAAGTTQGMTYAIFSAGEGTVQSTYGGSGNTVLTLGGVPPYVGATANFVVSGGVYSSTNQIKLTGLNAGFINQGAFFNGGDFAWLNATNGYLRAINYAVDTGAASFAGGTTYSGAAVHLQLNGALTAQATGTLTTLRLNGNTNVTLASGATLTVNGLLKAGNAAGGATISGGTAVRGGASGAELVVRTDGVNDALTINVPIVDNGGNALTKSGAGTLTLGGANTFTGGLFVNAGTLTFAAGSSLTGGGSTTVNAGGTLNVNGSVNLGSNQLLLDGNSGSMATVTLSGSGVTLTAVAEFLGYHDDGAGAFTQSGGTNAVGTLHVGFANWTAGSYTLSAGSLNASADEYVGNYGGGTFTQSGGTNTVSGTLYLGYTSTYSSGTYTLGAGAVLSASNEYVGAGGSGTFTQNGGTNTVGSGGTLFLGYNLAASGTYSLNGGTLLVPAVAAGTGTGTFNFNGGTLQASGNSATFMTGLAAAYVQTNGAKIDSNTYNITVGQALLHDPALGATADGGITKAGAGTLTLTGASTYTGPTSVNAGTLLVNGSLGGGVVTVAGSGTVLGGTGAIAGPINVTTGGINPGGNTGANGSSANVGTLTIGALTLSSGATTMFDVYQSTSYDTLSASGTVALGGTLAVSVNSGASFTAGQMLDLIHTTGTLSGTFAGISNGSVYNFGGNSFQALYTATDFELVAVPEPATWLGGALLAGAGGLLLVVRRQTRQVTA